VSLIATSAGGEIVARVIVAPQKHHTPHGATAPGPPREAVRRLAVASAAQLVPGAAEVRSVQPRHLIEVVGIQDSVSGVDAVNIVACLPLPGMLA
jgi:hypothetical protein